MSNVSFCALSQANGFFLSPFLPMTLPLFLTCDSWVWVGHAEKQGDIGDLELGKMLGTKKNPIQTRLTQQISGRLPTVNPVHGERE
jgi:hypothetical protein